MGIFLIGSVIIIFVSQGFSLNLEEWTIEKRGGLFLKFAPSDAALFINGKKKKVREGFLSQGMLVSNLAPGAYRIALQKEGFAPWEKEMEVYPGIVSSESNIRLWPTNPVLTEEASSSQAFWITGKGLVTKSGKGSLMFNGKELKGTEMEFADAADATIITKLGSTLFLTNLSNPQESLNISDLFLSLKERQLNLPGIVPIEHAMPHPFNNEKVLVTTQTSLYILDTKRIELERIFTAARMQPVLTRSSQEAFIIDAQNNLVVINLIFKTSSRFPLHSLSAQRMETTPDGKHVLIVHGDKNTLSAYDTGNRSLQELASSVSGFALSPDGKKVAFAEQGKVITVFFLEERYEENRRWKKGSSFSLPETDPVRKIIWPGGLPGHLLILRADKELIVQEATPTLPANSALLAENVNQVLSKGKKIFLSRGDGTVAAFDVNRKE